MFFYKKSFLFFLLLNFSVVACSQDGIGESSYASSVAVKFINEYYKVKDIDEVKRYLHSDMLDSLNEKNLQRIRLFEKIMIASWSSYEIRFDAEKNNTDNMVVVFVLEGVRNGSPDKRRLHVNLAKEKHAWKVLSLQ